MSVNTIQKNILEAIDTIARRRIDQLKVDKTITAIIVESYGVVNGKNVYKVEYEGGYFNATAINGAYLPRMAVYVQVPEGNFSKEKFILGQASTLATDTQKSVVAAAASNLSIIGGNAIKKNKSESDDSTESDDLMGVYSYHDSEEENKEKGGNPDLIKHRYNFLYQYDNEEPSKNQLNVIDEDLKLYKKEATSIMIKADFQTVLTEEQRRRITGEYGLIFNLVFKNLAAGLGETQGEVFDYFCNESTENYISSIKDITLSLKKINEDLYNYIYVNRYNNILELKGQDKLLDQVINRIQELERVFKEENKAKYTETVKDLFAKYIVLVKDIQRADDIDGMRTTYEEWRNLKIGLSSEKIVSYYFSSNEMIGNPFSFSSWTSQYGVFKIDLDNFLRVDSILMYKEGFIQNQDLEKSWHDGNPDICVQNIQMYMMKSLSEDSAGYQLKVEADDPDVGMVFQDTEEMQPIIVKASLFRELYEDLTLNQNTRFYWFKQNSSIVSPKQTGYSIYGGIGWSKIDTDLTEKLEIYAKDNEAYENYFRCAAVYTGEETPIILRFDFIIFNYGGQRFVLQSDLGTNFSFDAGTPTITIFKQENDSLIEIDESDKLDKNKHYQFKWAIVDGNNQKTFLNEEIRSLDFSNMTVANYTNYTNSSNLLKGIEWFIGDNLVTANEKKVYATRIKYPLFNVPTASTFSFECYIDYRADVTQENFHTIGKAILDLNNLRVLNPNSYRVFIENGDQVFQYDEYGNAPNSPKYKDPKDILPLKIHLFAPNNIEVQESSYRVRWYFPVRDSLIQYSGAMEDPATGKLNLYKGNEVGFDINPLYDYNSIDNQIRCQVDFNEQTIYASTDFIFTKVGNNGTNGTDMVAKITPKTWYPIYNDQSVTLYISENNNRIYVNGIPNYITSGNRWLTGNNGIFDVKLYQKTQEVEINQSNIRWNVVGNTSTSSNKNGKNIVIENNLLKWNNSTNKAYRQYILKAEIRHDGKTYYASYGLPVIFYKNTLPTYDSSRIAIATNGYVKEVVYNADGRNPLYNHNQGLELINLPDDVTIDWYAKGGYITNENTPCFKLLLNKDGKEEDGKKENPFISKTNTNKSKVYILPDDAYSGAVTNNYIQADIKQDNSLIATVIAPINMSLNTYGLASLNDWDGNTINIDNDNGYIMAPQIGAGYKDDATNHFTGVVMGQADDYSSNGEHEYTGLIGYSHGVQSIFLNAEDGSASFGVPSWTVGNKEYIRKWNGNSWENSEDNYNEGRIELRPGDVSKIGGWRLGRRSLYYIEGNTEIGPKYGTSANGYDYIPKKNGTIERGTEYSYYHEKDIPHNKAGILIHSGQSPYISIKGKQIAENDSILDTEPESFIRAGDSIELQLDPMSPTVFSIFRHNGKKVDKPNNSGILYEQNSRTFLAGISPQGELVANTLQAIVNPSQGKETTANFSTNRIAAFSETNINASYIGTMSKIGTITIAKIFKEANSSTDDTLYFSGSGRQNNEYIRPLSFHGKEISLYASKSGSTAKTTNTYITLSEDAFKTKIGNSSYFELYKNNTNISSELYVTTPLKITTSSENNFILDTAKQTFNASGGLDINVTRGIATLDTTNGSISLTANGSSGTFDIKSADSSIDLNSKTATNITAGGAISIKNTSASEIEIKRNNDNNNRILLSGNQFWAKADANNYLNILGGTSDDSILKISNKFKIESEDILTLSGRPTENNSTGAVPSLSGIVLIAYGTNDNNRYTQLRLTPRFVDQNNACYPFYLETSEGAGLAIESKVKYGFWRSCLRSKGLDQNIQDGGLQVEGTFQYLPTINSDLGLFVNNAAWVDHWLHIQGINNSKNHIHSGYSLSVEGPTYLNGGVTMNNGDFTVYAGQFNVTGNNVFHGNVSLIDRGNRAWTLQAGNIVGDSIGWGTEKEHNGRSSSTVWGWIEALDNDISRLDGRIDDHINSVNAAFANVNIAFANVNAAINNINTAINNINTTFANHTHQYNNPKESTGITNTTGPV